MPMQSKGFYSLFLLLFCLLPWLAGCDAPNTRQAVELYAEGKYKEALPIFINAAGRRDPVAYYFMARMYERGQGVDADPAKAMNLYMNAANEGLDRGRAAVAAFQAGNQIEVDKQLAILQSIAENDPSSGLAWYCEALHQLSNDPRSEYDYTELLQSCINQLRGVDQATAFRLLSSAYAGGLGVKKDPAKALSFAEQAAEAGDIKAHSSIAYGYYEGVDRPSDLVKAYAHAHTALVLGGKTMSIERRTAMEQLIKTISRRMSAGQMAQGKQLAEQVRKNAEQSHKTWLQQQLIDWAMNYQPKK
ncbi:tetratricopeptide repeat protein [Permianibacter aggregans]|uniref:Sel1 repeat-containing protein n=1 Tax=Permianibacter aggregans TaxID=1510150 RepID=A0A4V3D6X4_9GAMM|nr:tetratricopeptide repeat protein [Permianibacter aggregans]TDQ45597.1 Sel1 repeat-containing protein [Permianibacter aggregans]